MSLVSGVQGRLRVPETLLHSRTITGPRFSFLFSPTLDSSRCCICSHSSHALGPCPPPRPGPASTSPARPPPAPHPGRRHAGRGGAPVEGRVPPLELLHGALEEPVRSLQQAGPLLRPVTRPPPDALLIYLFINPGLGYKSPAPPPPAHPAALCMRRRAPAPRGAFAPPGCQ